LDRWSATVGGNAAGAPDLPHELSSLVRFRVTASWLNSNASRVILMA
jgi:hypothetical protein